MKTSTAKMHDFYEQPKNKVMNGPRPSPLMINKDSHLIRKPPVSSTISQKQQQKGPVIIYTQSPKIIHTKAQDFMALVQRLTGRTSTKETTTTAPQASDNIFGSSSSSLSNEDNSKNTIIKKEETIQWMQHGATDGEINSSALRKDDDHEMITCGLIKGGGANSNLNFADMPLFTPTSYDFFCSPSRPLYKFSDSPYGILGSLISPSGLGFINDLPEY